MKTPRKKLIAKLDRIFSQYIRLRDSHNGFVTCCTCGKIVAWKQADCGHYHNRRHMSLRWDEVNCNAQCRSCNRFEEGEKAKYRDYLHEKYGKERIDLLDIQKNTYRKWHVFELELLLEHYKQEVKKIGG